MKYLELNLHQRISLKGIIKYKRERNFLTHRREQDGYLDGLCALWMVTNYIHAIEYFLNN